MKTRMLFYLFFIIVGLTVSISTAHAEPITDYIRDTYLHIDPAEVDRLAAAEARGLMEIKTVILPEGENLWGINWHLGWPIATMVDDVIIVFSRRMILHGGCPATCYNLYPNSDSDSGRFVVRSADAGQTWGPMLDLDYLFDQGGDTIGGGMNAIGVTPSGDVIAFERGLARSSDKGRTWTIDADAFSGISQPGINIGPNLLHHP